MKIVVIALLVLSSSLSALEMKYAESCNAKNNYLQPKLKSFVRNNPTFFGHDQVCAVKSTNFLNPTNWANIKNVDKLVGATNLCIYASLKNNPLKPHNTSPIKNGSRYVSCESDTGKGERYYRPSEVKTGKNGKYTQYYGNEAPCVTRELHETLVKSFLTVTECTGVDKGAFFSIINHESRFQLNVGNTHNVYGIGQLTSIGAREVNRIFLERKKSTDFNYLKAQYAKRKGVGTDDNDNACHRMRGTLLNPIKVDTPDQCARNRKKGLGCDKSVSACERAAFPRNPLRSFLYAALLHKKDIQGTSAAYDKIVPAAVKKNLKKSTVLAMLTRYTYNGGIGDITTLLKNFIITKESNHPVDPKTKVVTGFKKLKIGFKNMGTGSFLAEFEDYILNTKHFPSGTAKQRELGKYVSNMVKDKANLEGYLSKKGIQGIQCGL